MRERFERYVLDQRDARFEAGLPDDLAKQPDRAELVVLGNDQVAVLGVHAGVSALAAEALGDRDQHDPLATTLEDREPHGGAMDDSAHDLELESFFVFVERDARRLADGVAGDVLGQAGQVDHFLSVNCDGPASN